MKDMKDKNEKENFGKSEFATFGAGCFWGVQVAFSNTPGVVGTSVGYMGGDEKKYPNPTYEQVCSDKTGYVEVVHVQYNPDKISYEKILEVFWENHNPTTKNRQGPDIGSQYASVIFYHTPRQRSLALLSKIARQKKIGKPIVTEIREAATYFLAEDYHQRYLEKRGLASCKI